MSPGRLASFIDKHDVEGLVRVYLKAQLVSLCQAYEVNFNKCANKQVLAAQLKQAVQLHSQIPNIASVSVSPILGNTLWNMSELMVRGKGSSSDSDWRAHDFQP